MIRLYDATETNFDHYETVLDKALTCVVDCEENGLFSLSMTHPLDSRIQESKILKVPTPDGEQLFRIARVRKVVGAKHYLDVYARHISYDLLDNLILNIRPTDATQQEALTAILAGTEAPHSFTATSDVMGTATANYVRMNPIQAIMGQQDNSVLNLWGGYLKRDNFLIKVVALSPDKGYEVAFGKNLKGLDEEIDLADVVTRLYPTVVITDNVVTELPEKYVDSPLIGNYPHPIIREYRIALTEDEKLLPIADIYTLMRTRCAEQYTAGADKPKVNYKVDFVQLNKTAQFSMVGFNDPDGKTPLEMESYTHAELEALAPMWYGQIMPLEMLDNITISDAVYVEVPLIGVSLASRVIKYQYDALWQRFNGLEIGNFRPKLTNQTIEFRKVVEDAIIRSESEVSARLKEAMDKIVGNTGGYVITRVNELGQPIAHIYTDNLDPALANNYIVINSEGIAFGSGGLSTVPNAAIAIDGSVVASSAFFSSLKTNLIESDLGSNLTLSSNNSIRLVSNSIVTIDENGLTVGKTAEQVKSILTYNGLEVVDGDKTLLAATNAGVKTPELQADSIVGDVINTIGNTTLNVGTGQNFPTITAALSSLNIGGKKVRIIRDNEEIIINVYGEIADSVLLYGYTGGKISIIFQSGARLTGRIVMYGCTSRIFIYGFSIAYGTIKCNLYHANLIEAYACAYVSVRYMNFDDSGYGYVYGFRAHEGTRATVRNCDFLGHVGVGSYDASMVNATNNIGNLTNYGYSISNAVLSARGTAPNGVNGVVYDTEGVYLTTGTIAGTDSVYDPPDTVPTTFVNVFSPSYMNTYSYEYGAVSSWYGAAAAQNRWDTSTGMFRGQVQYGASLYDYILDRDGGTTPTVQIRLHRKDSTHGAAAGVAPTPHNFSATFGTATRGNWTAWATVPYTLITASGFQFQFYNNTTGSTYAIWDACEVKVTKVKTV